VLPSKDQFATYLGQLRAAHRENNLEHVMCRSLVSVDYRGFLYDCDFNQMLELPLGGAEQAVHLSSLLRSPPPARIATAGHCYGCAAGQGSSCGGTF